jgi:hypothetical protein
MFCASILKTRAPASFYLDSAFNSQASYNVLYREPSGQQSKAQIEAFLDTWHWNDSAEQSFDEVVRSGADAAELMCPIRAVLRESALTAHLTMMVVPLSSKIATSCGSNLFKRANWGYLIKFKFRF